jgi:hypothetical protein
MNRRDPVQQQRDNEARLAQGRIDTARATAKKQHDEAAKNKQQGGDAKAGKKKAAEHNG